MLIDDIIEFSKPYIISVEEGGSRSSPYIRNPKDNDIVLVVEDENKKAELVRDLYNRFKRQDMRNENLDLKIRVYPNDLSNRVYWYTGNFNKPLEGFVKQTKNIPISEKIIKQVCINYLEHIKKCNVNFYKQKPFYHVYTSLCVLNHNSFELTEEEIDNINILHDRKEEDFETIKKLIDEMVEEIQSWQQV